MQEGLNDCAKAGGPDDPSNAERQRDVSVSLDRIGDVRRTRSDLPGALEAYEEGLKIRRKLAADDPSNAERLRDVSVSLNKVGDVLRTRSDLPGALEAYEEGLTIARKLAADDPTNAERQIDLGVSLAKLAQVAEARSGSAWPAPVSPKRVICLSDYQSVRQTITPLRDMADAATSDAARPLWWPDFR